MATALDYSDEIICMEYNTGTTDGAGDLDVTLDYTPTDANGIMLYCNDPDVVPINQGLAGAVLTIRFYKRYYEKPSTTDTDAENLPGGVTKQGAKQNTDAGGAGAPIGLPGGGPNYSFVDHVHGVSFQYTHSHDITSFTTTDVAITTLATTAVTVSIMYVRTVV